MIAAVRLASVPNDVRSVFVQFLVAVDIDHRSISKPILEPNTHGAVGVMPLTARDQVALLLGAKEDADVDLGGPLVDDDLARAVEATPQQDSKFELTWVALSEAFRSAHNLPVVVGAAGRPPLKPRLAGGLRAVRERWWNIAGDALDGGIARFPQVVIIGKQVMESHAGSVQPRRRISAP